MAFASRKLDRLRALLAAPLLLLAAAAALSACTTPSAFEQLATVQPTGGPFTQALYKNYAYLARSYGTKTGQASSPFDVDTSMSLSDVNADVAGIAETFANKAVAAANGDNVLPEAAPDGDDAAEGVRLRLLRGLDQGREKAPADAARAQSDFDCWVLNGQVDQQRSAASACKRSLDNSLAQLERDLNPAPVQQPIATTSPTAVDFTVYFDFDSWSLSAEELVVLQKAVDTARAGGQTRITVVGHTDTSGTNEYNQGLSERRASVVKDVLVQMGARAQAITISGTGENDLAVQTGDGVREPKNRRAVVTLLP